MNPDEGGDVCDTSNFEVLKFVQCMTELENLVSTYCSLMLSVFHVLTCAIVILIVTVVGCVHTHTHTHM
jgi:hypothetical protein